MGANVAKPRRKRPRTGDSDTSVKETVVSLEKLINKRWGEGTLRRASDPTLAIERIPCGILTIDHALGGGFSRGRHTEIYGGYSVGKTYTAYRLIASAQARGHRSAFVDVEGTFDPDFAASAGVDLDALDYHRQEHGNRVIDFMETLLKGGDYGVIVLDSIAALLPKAELESDMEAGSMGMEQAKLMSKALRKLTVANRTTALVYINQIRSNVGVMFGKRTTTSGGLAMGHYAGTRIEMVRTENIKKNSKVVDPVKGETKRQELVKGHRVLVRIEKDKTGGASNQSTTSFVFDYDLGGADHVEDLIYLGLLYGHINKKGTTWWVTGYDDEKQVGRGKFVKWLRKNRAVQQDLEELIEQGEADEAEEDS